MAHVLLTPGDPAPRFRQRSGGNPAYAFDTAAGRYLVLCFLGSGGDAHARQAIAGVRARPDLFDDARAAFFAVSNDPTDEEMEGQIKQIRKMMTWKKRKKAPCGCFSSLASRISRTRA